MQSKRVNSTRSRSLWILALAAIAVLFAMVAVAIWQHLSTRMLIVQTVLLIFLTTILGLLTNMLAGHKTVADLVNKPAEEPPAVEDLTAYRQFIIDKKCNALQLAVMHSSTYEFDRKVTLWSIFVPQSARESAPLPEVPTEILRRLHEEGHIKQAPDEEALLKLRTRYQASPVRPITEILDHSRLVVIVGDPGSGKTSLLRYRALCWAKEDRGPLPLLVDLKEYVKARKGIVEYCFCGPEVFPHNPDHLLDRLLTGRAAVYLDGLDEIFDISIRQSVIDEIVVLSAKYPLAPIVVTSRRVGYEPEQLRNVGFLHATLEEFDLPQMLHFLRQWHQVAEPDDKERDLMYARLKRALEESPAIRELAGNPLLLTMMAILNRNQELPRNRVALYREAARVLLDDWDARKALPVGEFDREDKEALLREIAGEMQQAEGGLAGNLIDQTRLREQVRKFLEGLSVPESHSKANLLVKQLTERNFILAYAGADRFSFVHRTFLEFFCAAWFADRFQQRQDLTLDALKTEVFGRHWRDERWHEVLRLIAGMLVGKAEELIIFLMEQNGRNEKLANLMLAAGCLNEVRNRGVMLKTSQALWKRMSEEGINFETQEYQENYFVDYDDVRTTRRVAVRWMATAWKGEGANAWLRTEGIHNSDWLVRQAAVQELARGWAEDPATLQLIQESARNDSDYDVRQMAVRELAHGWKGDADTLQVIQDLAQNDPDHYVRYTAVLEMAHGWKDNPSTLTQLTECALKDLNSNVRLAAFHEMTNGWKNDPNLLVWLKSNALHNVYTDIRQAAVSALARGWKEDPNTLLWLRDTIAVEINSDVRRVALQELVRGWKNDPDTLPLLQDLARRDTEYRVRQAVVPELARGWKDEPGTLPLIQDLAKNDTNPRVRQAAVQELNIGWWDDPGTRTLLNDRARYDTNKDIRRAAMQRLSWLERLALNNTSTTADQVRR